jgi:hypothetical protein
MIFNEVEVAAQRDAQPVDRPAFGRFREQVGQLPGCGLERGYVQLLLAAEVVIDQRP